MSSNFKNISRIIGIQHSIIKQIFLLFTVNCSLLTINCFSQGVAINTTGTKADVSAMLDISSTSQGLLIPRMSVIQRNNIPSPALSLLIFNTTTNCFEAYINGSWYSVSCPLPCSSPDVPSPGTNNPSQTQIVWNWNTVNGATGYKWNTANNYTTAIDNLSNVSYTQSGLTCNTSYTLYVWTYNACGNSSASALTSISPCICTISACGSQQFMCNNINTGTQVAPSATQTIGTKWCFDDVAANCDTYGGLYQWATAMNLDNSYDNVPITTPYYNTQDELCNPCGPSTGKHGIQGICPYGFHFPTDLEWSQYEYCVESSISPTGTTPLSTFQNTDNFRGSTDPLIGPAGKMKASTDWCCSGTGSNTSGFTALPAGYILGGGSYNLSSVTYFWTATEPHAWGTESRILYQYTSQILRQPSGRYVGCSVRCLKD
jgi:uncharacterized protein (TIGR02145 family)